MWMTARFYSGDVIVIGMLLAHIHNGSYLIVSFPVDGIVWGPWSTCTKTCDTGTQERLGYVNGSALFVHTADCGVIPCHGKFTSRCLKYPPLPPPPSAPVVVTLRRCWYAYCHDWCHDCCMETFLKYTVVCKSTPFLVVAVLSVTTGSMVQDRMACRRSVWRQCERIALRVVGPYEGSVWSSCSESCNSGDRSRSNIYDNETQTIPCNTHNCIACKLTHCTIRSRGGSSQA